MLTFTRTLRNIYLFILISLALRTSAQAQAMPAWTEARNLGSMPTAVNYGYGGVAVDAAGNMYEAGTFTRTFTLDGTTLTSLGYEDAYLAKYTSNGTLAWVRQIGSTGVDIACGVALDAAGNAYVTGTFARAVNLGNNLLLTAPVTTSKAFVVRYSPQGIPEWAQQSTRYTHAPSISADALGHVYLVGTYSSSLTLGGTTISDNGTTSPAFLARLSAATGAVESLVQAFYYQQPTGISSEFFSPIVAAAPSGEVYIFTSYTEVPVFGTLSLPAAYCDILVAHYSAQGTFEWVRSFGSASTDLTFDGIVDTSGNLYLAAALGGPTTIGDIALPYAGGYSDGCLVKYSPQGNVQWAQASGSLGNDYWYAVCLDAANNPYVVGEFTDTAQFGPFSLTSAGGSDVVVAAYSAQQGSTRWALRAGGGFSDSGRYLGSDASGKLYVLGSFSASSAFGPYILTGNTPSLFMAHLNNAVLATRTAINQPLSVYPNPTHNQLHLPALPAGTRVQLIDALGRVVRETTVSGAAQASVWGLAPNLYTVRATDPHGQQYTGRVLVQ